MKIERILGEPRFWYMLRVDIGCVSTVFDKVGITAVRFWEPLPAIGGIYEPGRIVQRPNRPQQYVRARVLRKLPLDTVQEMMARTGVNKRIEGHWYEVISD